MVHEYMIKRKTNRWPFSFFMNLIDVVNIAAYIIWCKKFPYWNSNKSDKRNLFLRGLGEELVTPLLQQRVKSSKLQMASRKAISKVLKHAQVIDGEAAGSSSSPSIKRQRILDQGENIPNKRRRCHMCHSSKSKMQKQYCDTCKKNVCNDHSTSIRECFTCMNK